MLFALLALFLPIVYCDGVSIKIAGHSELCVYSQAKQRGEKVAFYFSIQALDGAGEYGIKATVKNTKKELILETERESQGDYVFAANAIGEYTFCFVNPDSGTKLVYVDVTNESDTVLQNGQIGTEIAKVKGSKDEANHEISEKALKIEEVVRGLNAKMDNLQKQMMYLTSREGRSIATGILINFMYSEINAV
jgi:tetrahydromethanopterin S-methyltransferase subunit B